MRKLKISKNSEIFKSLDNIAKSKLFLYIDDEERLQFLSYHLSYYFEPYKFLIFLRL